MGSRSLAGRVTSVRSTYRKKTLKLLKEFFIIYVSASFQLGNFQEVSITNPILINDCSATQVIRFGIAKLMSAV